MCLNEATLRKVNGTPGEVYINGGLFENFRDGLVWRHLTNTPQQLRAAVHPVQKYVDDRNGID